MTKFAEAVALLAAVIVAVVGVLFLVGAFSAIGAFFTMIAINYLFAPAVILFLFGTVKIGFFKAFVLNVLAGILFGSKSASKS